MGRAEAKPIITPLKYKDTPLRRPFCLLDHGLRWYQLCGQDYWWQGEMRKLGLGDPVILQVCGPTDDGIRQAARVDAVDGDEVIVAGHRFRNDVLPQWDIVDEGRAKIRHVIHAPDSAAYR
jgi:hypothetical protein